MNKVTILCVAYNQEKYINQTLAGFVMQKTDFPFVVIIGDDCSTDGTAQIISVYAEKYPNIIQPIFNKKNMGAEQNFFNMVKMCNSQYVATCEGDDYFIDPLKLQKQVDFLDSHPECSICFHPVLVSIEGSPQHDSIFPSKQDRFNKEILELDDLLKQNFIQTNSVMYRWRFSGENQFNDFLPHNILPGDWYIHLLHAKKGKIGFIDEVMAVYRRHPGGVWWENLFDLDSLHLKHGINELNFYIAVENEIMEGDKKYHKRITNFTKYLIDLYTHHQKFEELAKVTNLAIENKIFEEQTV